MYKQDTFNIVAEHLLKQGDRAAADGSMCLYRAPDGKKCAFGVLIPDELYDPILENTTVDHIFGRIGNPRVSNSVKYEEVTVKIREHIGPIDSEEIEFLRKLQQIHDTTPPEYWDLQLAMIAGEYTLTVNAIIHNRRR